MAQAVPLRGVLQRQRGLVVRQHVDRAFLQARHLEVQVRLAVAARGRQRRRMAARIEHVAARQVQRQRQAEDLAGAHFAHGLQHFFFGQQVQAADLVVRSEIAPGRSSGRRVQRFMGLFRSVFRVYMNIVRIYVLLIHRHSSDCRHSTPPPRRGSACGWRRARHAAWPAWFKVGSQWFVGVSGAQAGCAHETPAAKRGRATGPQGDRLMTRQQHARALRAAFAFTIAALAVATGPAAAAGYPEHPVTVVSSAGRRADLLAAPSPALEPGLKQTVLVENRPGRAAISAWPTWRGPRPTATRWAWAPSARKASIPSCTPT